MAHIHGWPACKRIECLECGASVENDRARHATIIHTFAKDHESCAHAPHRQWPTVIRVAASLMLSPSYVRVLVWEGRLESVKVRESVVRAGGRARCQIHHINPRSVDAYVSQLLERKSDRGQGHSINCACNFCRHKPDCTCPFCDPSKVVGLGNKRHKPDCECPFCAPPEPAEEEIHAKLPRYLRRSLKREAVKTEQSMGEVVRQALTEYFDARGIPMDDEELELAMEGVA